MTEASRADTVVALYALPMKIVEVGMMYGTIFLNSLLPVLTVALEQKDTKKVHSLMTHAWKLLLFFGVGIATAGYALAPDIIRLISSREYIDTVVFGYTSVDAFRIVVWIFLFYFLSSLFTYTLIARSSQAKMLTINAIVASVNIVGNIIVIPQYSFVGSAWVTLLSQVLLLVLTYLSTARYIPLRSIGRMSLTILLSAMIGYAAISVLSPLMTDTFTRFIVLG
jgi:O-antigen/teichoic acid export membrane protein